jgi:hypothetical protein
VGKSSVINSLKRSRAVSVGATPGVTKSMQEVHLDKLVKLLDCPGIVFNTGSGVEAVLRNAIKVEQIEDPIAPGACTADRNAAQGACADVGPHAQWRRLCSVAGASSSCRSTTCRATRTPTSSCTLSPAIWAA